MSSNARRGTLKEEIFARRNLRGRNFCESMLGGKFRDSRLEDKFHGTYFHVFGI